MGDSETGKAGFVQPNTFQEVVGLAMKLAEIVADTDWVLTAESRSEVLNHINWLLGAIFNLPMKPGSGEHSLLYRLARAEAERTHGACATFEHECEKLRIAGTSDVSLGEAELAALDAIDAQLSAALRALIAMAIDIS